jgi:hypothetical protein
MLIYQLHGTASLEAAVSSLVPTSLIVSRHTVALSLFRSLVDSPEADWSCLLANSAVWKFSFISEVPISRAHKTHFFPEKCDLNSTRVLCADGKYYFQTYELNTCISIIHLYRDYDFSGSDDNFLGFCDE